MDEIREPDDSDLYDRDFDRWIDLQATHLRDGRYHLLDMVHLIDEIESLGKSQMFALRSSYALIAMHLLKQIKQPEKASASWENTINRERGNVVDLLEEIRALSQSVKRLSQKPTARARTDAAFETKLSLPLVADRSSLHVAASRIGDVVASWRSRRGERRRGLDSAAGSLPRLGLLAY